MFKKITLAGLATAILASCTPGQTEFSCKGYPEGVSCLSARNVYELTNNRSRVAQQDLVNGQTASGPAFQDVLAPLPSTESHQNLAPPTAAGQQAAKPSPGVMRVWMAPRVTGEGDVAAPNYVYSQVAAYDSQSDEAIERRFEPLTGQSTPVRAADEGRPIKPGDITLTGTSAPVPAPTPVTPSPSPGTHAKKPDDSVRIAEIYFDSGQVIVSESGKDRLNRAANTIERLGAQKVIIAGFTDHVGSKKANKRVAKSRADAVSKVLRDAGVLPSVIIQHVAVGEIDLGEEAKRADPNQRKVVVVAMDLEAGPEGNAILDRLASDAKAKAS